MNTNFKDHFINALLHFLYNYFVYFLFVVPFDLWRKAVVRLSEQKSAGSINIKKIKSQWPFLSFLKSFIIDFLIDGFILMSYVTAPIAALVVGINDGGFGGFLLILIVSYYAPLALSILRDLTQLYILPLKKFLSWVKKPAQYMDLKIENK